ncbi:MAG: ATP-binding protein [Bacteroidales bacterium]|jgi:serine/threonine-protein kinase RsbW
MQKNIIIQSEIGNLRLVEKAIDDISSELGISQDNYGKIMVSTMEAVNNAIVHGNKSISSRIVRIEIIHKNKILVISVEDEGQGFRPEEIPDPTKLENIQNISGRGVFLMTRLADKIEFNEKGNRVTMSFKDLKT